MFATLCKYNQLKKKQFSCHDTEFYSGRHRLSEIKLENMILCNLLKTNI